MTRQKTWLAGLMVMLLLCMQLPAAADEVVFESGFEKGSTFAAEGFFTKDPNGCISIVDTEDVLSETQTVTPHSGQYCAKFAETGTGGAGAAGTTYFYLQRGANAVNNPLEADSTYKLSFWYYCTAHCSPNLYLSDGMFLQCNGQFHTIPNAPANTWTYYEIFFATSETRPAPDMRFRYNGLQYFDDIRIEKADRAFLSFAETTGWGMSDFTDSRFLGNTTPQVRTLGTETAQFHSYNVMFTPKTAATGTVRVAVSQMPQTVNTVNTLVVGIYKDVDGVRTLKNIHLYALNFEGTPIDEDNDGETDYYRMANCTKYADVDMSGEEAGSYITAFLWNTASGMQPLSYVKTLGA